MPFGCRSGLTPNATGEESRPAVYSNPPLPPQLCFPFLERSPPGAAAAFQSQEAELVPGDKRFSDSRNPDLGRLCVGRAGYRHEGKDGVRGLGGTVQATNLQFCLST